MPAQILTGLLAFAPSLSGAITIFIARSFIASMDSSVRGAFLAAVVPKASRTRFLGIINVCKTLASAPGPTLSGQLASSGKLRFSFIITASIKICCEYPNLFPSKSASIALHNADILLAFLLQMIFACTLVSDTLSLSTETKSRTSYHSIRRRFAGAVRFFPSPTRYHNAHPPIDPQQVPSDCGKYS